MNKRNWINLIIVGLMVVVVSGCDKKTAEKAADQVKDGTKAVADKTGELAKEAAEGTKAAVEGTKDAIGSATDWTKAKMDEYLGDIGKQFSGFEDQFKGLATKAEGLTGDAKVKFDEQFAGLSKLKDSAGKEMEAMGSATGDAWTAAKGRFEDLLKEIKVLYDKMIAEL